MPNYYNNLNLNKNELQNPRLQNLASAPGAPVVGQFYYDTSASRFYYWNGTTWVNKATDSDLLQGQNSAYHLSRANHSGTQLASTISDFTTQRDAQRLDQHAVPTASVNLNSQKITNLGTPTLDTDAATKAYVDAARSGLDVKASVDAASTANVAGTYNATGGTSARGQFTIMPNTIDGVTLVNADRVLLKDQTVPAQNGIWVVTTVGTGANGVWDRASDFDSDAEVTTGSFTFVSEGTINLDTGWVLTTNDPIVIGGGSGTALAFTQFSGAGSITAGAGLTRTGNTLDVGQGTGVTVAADSISLDTAVAVRKYAVSFGDGTAITYTITHSLGTQDVTVAVRRVASPFDQIECDVECATTNTVILKFSVAPTTNEFRVVVHG